MIVVDEKANAEQEIGEHQSDFLEYSSRTPLQHLIGRRKEKDRTERRDADVKKLRLQREPTRKAQALQSLL